MTLEYDSETNTFILVCAVRKRQHMRFIVRMTTDFPTLLEQMNANGIDDPAGVLMNLFYMAKDGPGDVMDIEAYRIYRMLPEVDA